MTLTWITIWIAVWLACSVAAYLLTEGATFCLSGQTWDRSTKEFTGLCSLLLGPAFLLIAVELFVFAAIGKGLATNRTRRSKDS